MQKNNKNNNKNLLSEKTNSKEKEIQNEIVKREISQILAMTGSFNPISKLSEDNINKMLENYDKHDEREFKDKKGKRIFIITLSIFFGLLILSILFIFKDNTELLKIIIPSIISLSVGVIGGYGFGYKNGIDADN